MSDQQQLSDLCSICYTQKPKYRCPGCKTQTCSLPCYKRHQQRASCNGKRDPAVYVKRSQLATPAGIDQDYNYLKSVERSIEHASRETSDRGVGGRSLNVKGSERGLHPESALQRYLSTNRINVERAPKGMSRQKTNQTRFTKRQNVLWTVEWIDGDGSQVVQADCSASSSLQESYELMLQQKRNASLRTATGDGAASSATKRKRADVQKGSASKSSKLQQESDLHLVHNEVFTTRAQQEFSTQSKRGGVSATQTEPEAPNVDALTSEPVTSVEQAVKSDETPSLSFYLLKPGTTSTCKVLIPLDSRATLTASLQDHTVLEYPTLYTLAQSPESLTSPYMLEKDYNQIRKAEEVELNEAIEQAGPTFVAQGMRQNETVAAANTQIDPQKILDMLKRDVTR